MEISPDIRSVVLGNAGTISGRIHLHGFGLVPLYTMTTIGTDDVFGTIRFRDNNATGVVLAEIPVVANYQYGNVTFTGLSESDGYVLFPNGLCVTQTKDDGDPERPGPSHPPFDAFKLVVFYS